jgi:hypothetical protein
MTKQLKVPDPVYHQAEEVAEERDLSLKAAIAFMCREGGYDV